MVTFDEALARIVEQARPIGRERVALADATGRVLAGPVIAAVDSPPADVSAMDGYAVREADLGGEPLIVVGQSFPGAGFEGRVETGQCVRIFTGAPLSAGADRVIVQEIVRRDGDRINLHGSFSSSRHIRRKGSDFAAGTILLGEGRLLDPRAIVAAAAADLGSIEVWRRPRITVLGTGDELVAPGTARDRPGGIPESVSLGVAAMAEAWGGEVLARLRLPDQPDAIRSAAEDALKTSDLLVVTGGASVGEKDFAKPVLASLGLELIFAKVAIRPGKPVWFGRLGERLVLGLPGNPTSAMVTARLLMTPLVAGLAGREPSTAQRWRQAPLAAGVEACGDRETYTRARWTGSAAEPMSNQESGAQHALVEADLLIRRRAGSPAAEAGQLVHVIDF